MIHNSLFKILSILLIVGLNWFGLSAVIETAAYFNDTETSLANEFSVATLDFSLSSSGNFSPNITPTQNSSRNISVVNNGSLDFQYTASTTNASGLLCDYLNLSADLDGNNKYTGPLTSFYYNAGQFITSEDWVFAVSLPSNDPSLESQTCTFDFVFNGSQISGAGFSDQEIISNTVTSGVWTTPQPTNLKINEVYYHVKKPDHEDEPQNEWVEIYNLTASAVDISGWKITDNSGWERTFCVLLSTCSSTSIPAYGFAVVTPATSTWDYWPGIPSDAVKIVLGISIGNGLANTDTGDRVILKNADGAEIDAVSWLGDDYAFGAGNGITPATGVGHSIARKIKGVDTNSPDDWQKLTTPNPGTNPHLISGVEVAASEEGPTLLVETEAVENNASPSFSETLESATGAVTGFVLGEEEAAASASAETVIDVPDLAPVASGSIESSIEPSPEPLPEVSPEVTPEPSETTEPVNDQQPANNDSSIQAPTEPAIPVEPVTVESSTEPAPPADPPAPAPEQAPAPVESAPAPTAE